MMSMIGLWSCSSEEVIPGDATALKGEKVPVTITISRDDATRTELSENKTNGGLNDVWSAGDKLAVYNAEGVKAGELTIIEGENSPVGVFSGEVTAEEGEHDFNLWYTAEEATGATEADGKPFYFNSKKEMVVDLSKMPKYETITALSAMDLLSKGVKLSIADGKATVVESTAMQAHLALARFSLKGIEAGKKGTLTISNIGSVNGSTLYKERLTLSNGELAGTSERPEGIIINDVEGGKDIYMAFLPGTYTLGFHYVVDGVSYDYAFTNPTTLVAGVYYNAFTKPEGAEEGEIDGVNIPLQKEVFAELHIHANFEGADPEEIVITKPFDSTPKAQFDLEDYSAYSALPTPPAGYTFLGWSQDEDGTVDTETVTISSIKHNTFDVYAVWQTSTAVDHTKNPLAKWAESDLTRDGSGATVKGKFTGNYKTAGYFYQFGRNYGHQNYSVVNTNYDKIGVAKMNSNWTGGTFYTSLYGYVNGSSLANVYNGSGQNQKAKWYSATTNLASYPEYFLVAGNSNLQNWKGEIVFDTSIQHKHSWSERAEYYGYTSELCPEGYRLPTMNDWKKILPKGGHTYSTGTTSSFPTISEIKEDGDVTYAIRWVREVEGTNNQYLRIDALVVPAGTDIANVDWTDSNVVTRHFKAAGMIRPYFYLAQFTNQGITSYQWLEKATPQGKLNSIVSSIGAVQVSITRDDNWLSGFYWIDDPNQYYMEFRFDANNLQQQGSFINAFQPEVPIACNVRCIQK